MIFEPALALLEFKSIATGIVAGDAMVKRAPVQQIISGTVQPGHYLVLVAGEVASVSEAVAAGREIGEQDLFDSLFLPNVHASVVRALSGSEQGRQADALGIIETESVASAIHAADAGVKGAEVSLLQMRLADGLGGKGIVYFAGVVADVEAAVEIASAVAREKLLRSRVVAQLHVEMWPNVGRLDRFGRHLNWEPV